MFATICPLKNLPNFCHSDDVSNLHIYPFLTTIFFLHQLPLVCLLLCFLLLLLLSIFLAPDEDSFLSKALVFRPVGEYISLVLSVLSTSPVVVHSFLGKKNVFFHIHEITWVVVLYTTLRFVKGVYKPQQACVG